MERALPTSRQIADRDRGGWGLFMWTVRERGRSTSGGAHQGFFVGRTGFGGVEGLMAERGEQGKIFRAAPHLREML